MRVYEVGGIKEKVLAAHRAGVTRVILPKRNEKDLYEVPADVQVRRTYLVLYLYQSDIYLFNSNNKVHYNKKGKGKGRYSSSWEPHLRATGRPLPYGITECYLPPDTSERAPPNPSHAGWYSIYLPRRDGRLS